MNRRLRQLFLCRTRDLGLVERHGDRLASGWSEHIFVSGAIFCHMAGRFLARCQKRDVVDGMEEPSAAQGVFSDLIIFFQAGTGCGLRGHAQ